MRISRTRPLAAMAAVLSAVLLVGCQPSAPFLNLPEASSPSSVSSTVDAADSANQETLPPETSPPPAADLRSNRTIAPHTTAPHTTALRTTAPGASTAGQSRSSTSTPPTATCENPHTDLINTGFGQYMALKRIPVTHDDETFYNFQIRENHFDPCAELSYIVLEGSLGSIDNTGGTGSSLGDVVVFFQGDQLITDPLPFMMRSVESVEQTDTHTLHVIHGHASRTTAEGVTETFLSTHTIQNGTFNSDISGLPPEVQNNPTRIDVAAPTETTDPSTTIIEQTLVAGRYRLPINPNQNLLCDIGHQDGPIADCYADFPTTWKMNSTLRPQATRIIYTENPPHARGTADPAPITSQTENYSTVQGENTLVVGTALVDLRQPNQVTISTEQGGILITPDSYEVLVGPVEP
ncbi:hypothetical protein [Corynebacterium sp. A21]|uniref:hypothetical protein n=1 Tax=Corynebacterium sp. A21 TaxID=3457318 RepID=UPI003FD64F8E